MLEMEANAIQGESQMNWRKLLESESFAKSGSKIVFFGVNSLCDKESYDYISGKGARVVWMQDIRRSKVSEPTAGVHAYTQAAQQLETILSAEEEGHEVVYVSFNMEAVIASCYFDLSYRAQ